MAYGDEPWKFPLYQESNELDKKDKELCVSITIQKVNSYDLQEFDKYKKMLEEKEKEKDKNILCIEELDSSNLSEEEYITNIYKKSLKKRDYNNILCELIELNDEGKMLLEIVLSSKILQPYIKSHSF